MVPKNGKGNVKGNRTNANQLIKNEDTGDYSLIETKRSSSSLLSKGQKSAKEHVENGDGIFEVRSRDPIQNLRPGDEINLEIINELTNTIQIRRNERERIIQ